MGNGAAHAAPPGQGPVRNGWADAWAAVSSPQVRCNTSNGVATGRSEPMRDLVAISNYIDTHFEAFRLKGEELDQFTLTLSAERRAAWREIATPWELAHSSLFVVGRVADFGRTVDPVFDANDMLVGHTRVIEATTGVWALEIYAADGNRMERTIIGELGLEDDPWGNAIASTLATLGAAAAAGVARRLILGMAVQGGGRAAASSLLASLAGVARAFAGLFRNQAMARLRTTMMNKVGNEVVREAFVLSRPMVFRHVLSPGVLTFEQQAASVARNGLSLSTGMSATYGDGVYAYAAGRNIGRAFIDIEVEKGVAVESLRVTNSLIGRVDSWFRLLPATGSKLPVKIVGKNF